jgi:hypothetical protein
MPLRARIVIPALSVIALGAAIGAVASSPPGKIPGEIPLLALGAVVAVVVNLAILRRAVTIEGSQVVVRNMIRTYRVDLARIARVRPGDDGVAIYTDTGQKIVARAISQDFLAKAMRRRTMADDLTHAIANAARYAAGEPTPQPPKAVPPAARWLVVASAMGVASLIGTAFVGDSIWNLVLGSVSLICFMLVGNYWLYRRRERHRAL